MRTWRVLVLLLATGGVACSAQTSPSRSGPVGISAVGFAGGGFVSAPLAVVPLSVPQGPPYSLLEVETAVQTLGNGTQIRSRTETRRMQDANGRTRTETSREWNGAMRLEYITIYDPATRESITLHPRSRVAELRRFPAATAWTGPRAVDREYGEAMRAEYESQQKSGIHVETEKLEPKTILGERVNGTRRTVITPAGEQGNDSELRSVSEQWISPRLHFSLLDISDDPRSGHVVNEVTELHLEAPDPSVFQVPAGYRIFDFSPDAEAVKAGNGSLQ